MWAMKTLRITLGTSTDEHELPIYASTPLAQVIMQLTGEIEGHSAMHKPINRRYHDLDDPTTQPSMTWDMSNGDEIVVTDLATLGETGNGKAELTALAQAVCDAYEESL